MPFKIGEPIGPNNPLPIRVVDQVPAQIVLVNQQLLPAAIGEPLSETNPLPVTIIGSVGSSLTADKTTFQTDAVAGDVIATLIDPYGVGTTFSTVATPPAQLVLNGNQVLMGATPGVAEQGYTIRVRASNGQRAIEEAITFIAKAPLAPPVYAMAGNVSQGEGNGGLSFLTFTVNRINDISQNGILTWTVTPSGTNPASADDFYGNEFPTGTVAFNAGQSSAIFSVPIAGDAVGELNETFTVTLSDVVGGGTIVTNAAVGTILNDDNAPVTCDEAPSIEGTPREGLAVRINVGLWSGPYTALEVAILATDGTTIMTRRSTDADGSFEGSVGKYIFARVWALYAGGEIYVDSPIFGPVEAATDTLVFAAAFHRPPAQQLPTTPYPYIAVTADASNSVPDTAVWPQDNPALSGTEQWGFATTGGLIGSSGTTNVTRNKGRALSSASSGMGLNHLHIQLPEANVPYKIYLGYLFHSSSGLTGTFEIRQGGAGGGDFPGGSVLVAYDSKTLTAGQIVDATGTVMTEAEWLATTPDQLGGNPITITPTSTDLFIGPKSGAGSTGTHLNNILILKAAS